MKNITALYTRRPEIFFLGVFPFVLLFFSLILRLVFFSGFILADDAEEFALLEFLNTNGPDYKGYLQYRFSLWIFNLIFFKLFGVSELTFFLPTFLMSSSLCVTGYFILLKLRYSPKESFWAGLFVASVPFEVLIGSVRANDLILSWFIALSLLVFFLLEKRPVAQGFLMALFFWFAFYDKIWTVYFFPALALYFLVMFFKRREWHSAASFGVGTILLHSLSSLYWLKKMGVLMPYISVHPPTFPVLNGELFALWGRYPHMLFLGSEFGTTLFGWVPYLLIGLILMKIFGPLFWKKRRPHLGLDRTDLTLVACYFSFFLFLEFFPNSFEFDHYYSSPRIFRYLAPISFPMALHAAKLILDFMKSSSNFNYSGKPAAVSVLLIGILSLNLIQTAAATEPGRSYRNALMALIDDIREFPRATVYVESWLGFFMRRVYFRDDGEDFKFIVNLNAHKAEQYEDWLKEVQPNLKEGTFLITGIGSNVHYGGHFDGFRLEQFDQPLDSGWKRVGEYQTLSFLPIPEPARLWAWKNIPDMGRRIPEKAMAKKGDINDPDRLFAEGMKKFDAGACSEAQVPFSLLIENFPKHHLADDGFYFRSICEYSKGRWFATIEEFTRLLELYPESTWAAGAHYHMGISYRRLNNSEAARKEFGIILRDYAHDKPLVDLSKIQLKEMDSE